MSEQGRAKNHLVAVVVAVLAVVVAVFALLNRSSVAEKRRMQEEAVFLITADGCTVEVSMEEILSLDPQEVTANYKKSGKEPEQRRYTGVPFCDVLALKELDPQGGDSVVFTAADGYASALPIGDALDRDNCFIIIEEEGQPLGNKESGGSGPFRMILPKDSFSQRWCSFLLEVSFQ